jgi:hypothetical protein
MPLSSSVGDNAAQLVYFAAARAAHPVREPVSMADETNFIYPPVCL